jgi:transposase
VLKEGTRCRDRITRGKCREILGVFPALWTFVRVPGIEPTNNACERALRAAVLWRKGCFGTRSAAGSRFAERMLTVAATLQQQGRGLLDFLTLAVELHQSGERPPSLLPDDYTFRRLQATA